MKTTDSNEDEKALRKVLHEWRAQSPLPPRFQEGVWRRIEGVETSARVSAWSAVAEWIGTMLPRPALASAYVAIFLALGVAAGWTQGRQLNSRMKDELGQRYVQVLDPYLAPRHDMP